MGDTDQDLLRRMASGDQEALAAFYDRHAARLLGLLLGWLGQRADAEDVLQVVFWEVWNRAGQYDPQRACPLTWLLLIARSRARDHARRRGETPGPLAAAEEPGILPEAPLLLERGEERSVVRQALGQLPPAQARAIALAFFGGLTHEQIARRLDTPLGTVKTRIRTGMQRLRELLPRP